MKKLGFIAILTLFVGQAFTAELKPLFQNAKELNIILNDVQLKRNLSEEETIQKIEREDNSYAIYTDKHKIKAHISNQPSARFGRSALVVSFGKVEKLEK